MNVGPCQRINSLGSLSETSGVALQWVSSDRAKDRSNPAQVGPKVELDRSSSSQAKGRVGPT